MTKSSGISLTKDLEQEWEPLVARRDRTRRYVNALRIRVLNLATEPALQEQCRLKKCAEKELRSVRTQYAEALYDSQYYRRFIEVRCRATRDPSLAKEIESRLKRRKARLRYLERNADTPDAETAQGDSEMLHATIQRERDLIWVYTTPISKLEERRQLDEERCAQKLHELEIAIRAQEEKLARLETEYRTLRQRVKDDLTEAEKEFSEAHRAILEWACRDAKRLHWLLEREPHCRAEALGQYQHAHPEEKLSDLIPQENVSPLLVSPPSSARRKRSKKRRMTPADIEGHAVREPDAPWRFVLVDASLTHERMLDGLPESVDDLRALLRKDRHPDADPNLIAETLARVTRLSKQERQLLKRLVGVEPKGWKIVRAGDYRLFLDIDETQRRIRFLVRPRREAYTKRHWQ
ncbi:MAG: hypothetical protein G01um101438_788 [Parcubacteria group bacterium Gr01-1014_38]|nr:MAG: hypothetical protein G01um101438_788 [Parcubacteria group bacterium Gr01-1014_38]